MFLLIYYFYCFARTTFGQERCHLHPITLEMLLFMRENANYWDFRAVDRLG